MYRERAELVGKELDAVTNKYNERYLYRGNNHWVDPDSETPSELQHKFEQDFIDYYLEKEYEDEIHDLLEDTYPEEFC
jgi:hypothetical protein